MLQLNLNILWNFINIFIIFIIFKVFLINPVNNIIKKRQDIINKSLEDADNAKTGAENLKKEYEENIKDIGAKADTIIENAKLTAQREYDSIIESARKDADSIIKNADKIINEEKEKAVNDLRLNAADMVIIAAQKLTEKSYNEDDNKKMIDSLITEVGDRS